VIAGDRITIWIRTAGKGFRTRTACILILLFTVLGFHWQLVIGVARVPFDFEGYHYPLLYQIFRNLEQGVLTLWDNTSYSGMPFVHNVNAATYYPVHLVFLGTLALLGVDFALRLMQLLACFHYWLASVGMFLLLESFGFRRSFALVGGVLFACNGFLLAQAQHLGLVETVAWMPFAFLLAKKGVESGRWIYFHLLSCVLAIMVFIGFLPELLSFLIVFVLFALWLIVASSPRRIKALIQFGVAAGMALALSAIVILPGLEYAGYAIDLDRHGSMTTIPLLTALIPDFFGATSHEEYWGPIDSTLHYFYPGLLVPIFLPFGIASRRKDLRFFQILLPLAFLLVFYPTAEYLRVPFQALPLVGRLFRPVNMLIYVPFAAIVLSLAGLESVKKGWRAAISVVGWLLVVLALCYYATVVYDRSVIGPATVPIFLLLSVGLAALLLRTRWKPVVIAVLVAEVLWLNSGRFFAAYPGNPNSIGRDYVNYTNHELIRYFQSDPDLFRISVDQQNLGGPWNSGFRVWGLESINGFDPLISRQYVDFLKQHGLTWKTNRTFHLGDYDSEVGFRLLNVKYYLTIREITPPHPDFEKVMDGWYRVYRYRKFTPRYLLLPEVEPVENISIDHLREAKPVRLLTYKTNSRQLEVDSGDRPSFLFIGEMNFTGWKAQVDGQEAKLVPVNKIFLGLPIQPGKHQVELIFSPRSFWWGAGISLTAVAGIFLLLILGQTRASAYDSIKSGVFANR